MARPRNYRSPAEMQKAIDKYFEREAKPTICGLALALGFAQRKSLLDYEGYGDEFCNTIKMAKLRVENWYEQNLLCAHHGGAIFALKNFDWSDKQEIEHGVTSETAKLLGLIDGGSKGKLPDRAEGKNAGQ